MCKDVGVFVVPTGIGAKIGGYAGDASLYAKMFAEKIPLIVNPNVVNAACFSGITKNMFFVEGWSLSEFFKGNLGLQPSKKNKIGVIFDKAIPEKVLNIHINTINAMKTIFGFDIFNYELTDFNAGVDFFIDESGTSVGCVNNAETLLMAGNSLKNKGADSIAVVCLFKEPDEKDNSYEKGEGVDIVGGVEGIISHYLSKKLFLPCVHAPAFSDFSIETSLINPKAAAEFITPTFLPCLFFGLNNAPKIVLPLNFLKTTITNKNIKFLILPYSSLGNSLVFDSISQKIPIFAIKENSTVLSIDKFSLNIENNITVFNSYKDCFNYLF